MWVALDRLAATGPSAGEEERWRGRFVAALCLAAMLATSIQVIAYTATQAWPNALANAVGLALEVGWLFVWRRWKNAERQADLLAGAATLVYGASLLFNKDVSNLIWLGATPLLALFIGGRAAAVRWAILDGLVTIGGVAIIATDQAPDALVPVTFHDVLTRSVALLVVLPTVGVLWDLSARSIMKDLARANAEAQAATREKLRFLANVSHELRTPLHGLLGMAELLRADVKDTVAHDRLDVMEASGRLLAQLIDDLLDVTRNEASGLQVAPAPSRLDQLITRAVELHRPFAKEKGLTLDLAVEGPVGLTVRTDGRRFQQVVHNLVGNAVKFTPKGQVRVRLSARQQAEALAVTLVVEDSGPGIAKADQPRLFRPFSRIAEDHRVSGTGLGLSITRAIIERMGGTVRVDSDTGQGATFTIEASFPIVVGAVEPLATSATPELALHVLVVDDNLINRRLAAAQLERLGATTVLAVNGLDALSKLDAERFDLVLMDRHMPEVDGLEATRRWRARELGTTEHLPIIGVTASVLPTDLEACRESGMDEVLTKPLSVERLAEVIRLIAPAGPVRHRHVSGIREAS